MFFFDDIWLFIGFRSLNDLLGRHEQGVNVLEAVELGLVDLLDNAPKVGEKKVWRHWFITKLKDFVTPHLKKMCDKSVLTKTELQYGEGENLEKEYLRIIYLTKLVLIFHIDT